MRLDIASSLIQAEICSPPQCEQRMFEADRDGQLSLLCNGLRLENLQLTGGPVSQYLGGGIPDFGGVVAHGDHCVRTEFARMLQHALERLRTGGFANLGIHFGAGLKIAGQRITKRLEALTYGWNANRDPAHD